MPAWENTALWANLETLGRESEELRSYVRGCLNHVASLLSNSFTSPPDFTLHDENHSFRVAQRIFDLIPASSLGSLSDLEHALLLMASYLHDVGMTPAMALVTGIRSYLLTGLYDRPEIENELPSLRRWLDSSYPDVDVPFSNSLPIDQRLDRAETLTAHYCRYRHNDWSGVFIETLAQAFGSGPYPLWKEDLIALCRSHHFGLIELMNADFDLRLARPGNKLVNLRYLACLLRVADVLEFDPERTPDVVRERRSVRTESLLYWYKDHSIDFAVDAMEHTMVFTARTPNARIHKAVIETADQVDYELDLCSTIARNGSLLRGFKIGSADYYTWPWPPKLLRDIKPISNTFEYIDGLFRPDAKRIIDLLSGTRLYDTPLAAIRELLQNAFDAVREQLAYDGLAAGNGLEDIEGEARARFHRVSISFAHDDGAHWLVCQDSGVGMTRDVIEKYLLVSGAKPRPELRELRRRTSEVGLKYFRSGEFGIGVLSYFMIADKLVIETRPSSDAHFNPEMHGWRFESDGLATVGELRRLDGMARGSVIRLRLKEEYCTESARSEIVGYIKKIVRVSPCRFEIKNGNLTHNHGPGWVHNFTEMAVGIENELGQRYIDRDEVKSIEKIEAEVDTERTLLTLRAEALKSIRYDGPVSGSLSSQSGTYRVHIPYFDIKGEASPGFINSLDDRIRPFPDGKLFWFPPTGLFISWRGFTVSVPFPRISAQISLIIELDLVAGATVSLDRTRAQLDEHSPLLGELKEIVRSATDQFFQHRRPTRYRELSVIWALRNRQASHFWGFTEAVDGNGQPSVVEWRKVGFPAVYCRSYVMSFSPVLS